MAANPFFSVVIPVYNRARALRTALESVLAQDWRSYEVVVVDDGSTDDIVAVIEEYARLGIAFLRNEVNLGVGHTLNKGVRASRGEWVVLLGSDNQLLPAGLSVLRANIAQYDEKVAVVYGKSELVGVSARYREASKQTPSRWGYKEYLHAQQISEALAVARREVLLRFPYEEDLGTKRECGSLVWYAIGRAGYDFVWTREIVQRYEISADSLSGKTYLAAHPEEMVICNQKILERFGADLLHINKNKLVVLHQKTAFYCVMAGRRSCALRHAQIAWKLDPLNPRTLLILALCLAGPRMVRRLYPLAG